MTEPGLARQGETPSWTERCWRSSVGKLLGVVSREGPGANFVRGGSGVQVTPHHDDARAGTRGRTHGQYRWGQRSPSRRTYRRTRYRRGLRWASRTDSRWMDLTQPKASPRFPSKLCPGPAHLGSSSPGLPHSPSHQTPPGPTPSTVHSGSTHLTAAPPETPPISSFYPGFYH